jgi:beta-N-acetylhexosaminidase
VFLTTAGLEAKFHLQRHRVLSTEPMQLEKLGRHFIIGFRDWGDLDPLIGRRAIAGIYVSAANVRGLDTAGIRRNVDALQEKRRGQGLPPLWVATDQEGGGVSRLTPPLSYRPFLVEVVDKNADPEQRKEAVRQYAAGQGRELAAAGINLNFAPVVDINFRVMNANDRATQIYKRAISSNPEIVRDAADTYCTGLHTAGVLCTLKHFPGLGRVSGDTHLDAATLDAPVAELEKTDWVPFRALSPHAVTMVGHAQLTAIDARNPASFSAPVIGILRQWAPDGLLITDDFSMGAVYWSAEGIRGASIRALNAGIDLILVSYDVDQFYPAMDALLTAKQEGTLSAGALDRSEARLALTKPADR